MIRTLITLALLPLLGCETLPTAGAAAPPVTVDGHTAEWPGSNDPENAAEIAADARHLWIRFNPADGAHAIQAAPFTTRILIDADNDPATGRRLAGLGVDAMIALSPPNELGSIGIGSAVTRYDADATAHPLGHADLGFFFLPTHASESYEARLDRAALDTLTRQGPVTVRVEQVDARERVLWSAQTSAEIPPFDPNPEPALSILPAAPEAGVRVLSLNVLFSSPLKNPDAFRRAISGINPDIILFQEWFNTPQADIQAWMDTNMGDGWTVIAPDPREGVAVATRLTVLEALPDLVGDTGAARFVGALIDTPVGEILAASVHLKCCGDADSPEDQRRVEEAAAIHATVDNLRKRHPDASVAIGGDYNLVGSRRPLEILIDGLGQNDADLTPADTTTLGDAAAVTWVDEKSRFSPGRLDWVVIDTTRTPIARSFTLDTRRLSDASLKAAGLERDDSRASDHLPVVVDLVAAE